jgi:hypothetical protein
LRRRYKNRKLNLRELRTGQKTLKLKRKRNDKIQKNIQKRKGSKDIGQQVSKRKF